MDHIAHVFSMEEIVGHILKFLPMKELHRVARYGTCSVLFSVSYWRKIVLGNTEYSVRTDAIFHPWGTDSKHCPTLFSVLRYCGNIHPKKDANIQKMWT